MASLITVSDEKTIALSNAHFSYVMRVSPEGILEHVYYGAALQHPLNTTSAHRRTERALTAHFEGVKDYNLSDTPQEYPLYGQSDFRYPAFLGRNADGNSVFSFRYKAHNITTEKPKLNGLPSARGGDCETLILTLEDSLHNIELELYYTIYENFGVLARSSKLTNRSAAIVDIDHVFSTALELPAADYDLLHLHGTWAREFNAERTPLPHARFVIDSARGASSAVHNPFLAVLEKDATETQGGVYGTTLVYSGNFAISAERGEFGDIRILAGINPFNFGWRLASGESFTVPEALHVFSSCGLSGMSHMWHDFIRENILPARFKNTPRPTYLNTWEAAYFNVDEDKVLHLADKAAQIGVEMLVLDDGWFEGRKDDTSSLGDWTADKARFPSGIAALAQNVKAKGLKFGIWFEPEMVNPNSALYRAHPDWILHVPGRKASLGRNQLTLDLSRPEVCEHIFSQIDDVLSCGEIDYVKWDMNRNMTEIGSSALPPHQQCEVPHRYILGLYRLLTRLMEKYPQVLFENCASGGNRFDLGMLSFMPQGWISDMCDPIGRLEIINGASLVYPLDTMAAYIGPSPNHQNGRMTSLETRFLAGIFCAAKGVSLSEADIDADQDQIKTLMAQAKDMAPIMLGGTFDRLRHCGNQTCWQFITEDKSAVYIAYFHTLSAPNLPFNSVRLRGLEANAAYKLSDSEETIYGDSLMAAGLTLPYVNMAQKNSDMRYMPKGDFSACLITLRKV